MRGNIGSVLERGNNLSDLQDRLNTTFVMLNLTKDTFLGLSV